MRFLFLLALCATSAQAQINTEQLRKQSLAGVSVQLDVGGTYARGNADLLQLALGGRLDAASGRNSGFALARHTVARANGDTDVSNTFAHLRYNRELAPRIVGEAFAQAERNAQQRLQHRYLIGGGARFEIVETEAVGLAFGSTPMLEFERLAPEAMEADARAVRWSNYLSARLDVSDTAEAFAVVYAQPRVDTPGDFRVLSESRLDLTLTRSLTVRLRGVLRYDSQPPLGVESTDLSVVTGLVFNSRGR